MTNSIFITMADVRAHNANTGHNFFERKTMRFFRSRMESALYGGRYFITSEQYEGMDGTMRPRKYSVRQAEDDGSIKTVGEFQGYACIEDARNEARRLAKAEEKGTNGHG